jgi:predicted N-formylglutamate amidohydrolase
MPTMPSTRLAANGLAHKYRVSMTAFDLIRPGRSGGRPVLFICDHASNRLPESYGTLGLAPELLQTHIAYDIGAGTVARTMAEAFDAPAVLARWSRLLIDLNRGADDPTLVMKLSDGSVIEGNARADAREIARRTAGYHEPYHAAIAGEIDRFCARGLVPSVVSIHSFTPAWKGRQRPWEVGVLWDRDARLAKPLMESLAASGFVVGDNEPYSGELENDCLYRHGTMNGLPHVLIEIRQDLIGTDERAQAFALRLKPVLASALEMMGAPHIRFTRPLAMKGQTMDQATRTELEAAVFRRLVAHLRERTDVQNIDLMITGGFCRNCLGDWYREAAAEKGIALDKDEARGLVYGMAPSEWKKRYQKETTPEKQAAFEVSQKIHK